MSDLSLEQRVKIMSDAQSSFFCFTRDIFSKSVPNFVGGSFVERCCNYLQKYDRTMRIAARSHFKSFSFYSFVKYLTMFRGISEDLDIRYFSYNERMAGEHIQKIKALIRKNPYFDELIDLKSTAENVASFTWDRKHIINIRPHGIICLHPDEKVLTSLGEIPIQDVKKGNQVITHKGQIKTVVGVHHRNWNDVLVNIKISNILEPLKCTPQHKILAISVKECRQQMKFCYPVCVRSRGHCRLKYFEDYKPQWIESEKLKVGDIVLIPKLKLEKNKSPWKNKDVWRLIGYWLAEGSIKNHKRKYFLKNKKQWETYNPKFVRFTFNIKENRLINDVKRIINQCFDRKGTIENEEGKTDILFGHNEFANFLIETFGTGAKNKHIPFWVENLPIQFKHELIKGYWEGDGTVDKKGQYSIASISLPLLKSIQRMLFQENISSFIISVHKGEFREFNIKGRKKRTYYCQPSYRLITTSNKFAKIVGRTSKIKRIKKKSIWFDENFTYLPIKKITKTPYRGTVFDLTVKDDHSYTSQIVVSNSFTRGTKADVILVDDPLSDPTNPLHPTTILKVNDLFRSVILESIKPGGKIHVIASPLSRADFYYIPEIQKEFHTIFQPAIVKDANGNEVSTWPEFYTLEQIKAKIPVMGEKIFAAEMLLTPFYSADSFFNKEKLRKDIVNPKLRNLRIIENFETKNLVVAGLDVGRKKHPALLVIFHVKNGKAIMIHLKITRNWPFYTGKPFDPLHPSLVEYCKEAIKRFGIDKLYYDNSRGELEGASDAGYLTPHFVPVVFTHKMRLQMATDFDKVVLNKQVEFFDDEEFLNSVCSVTNDLVSIESVSGHADAFWACALALIGFNAFDVSSKQDKEIRTGSPSIFEEGQPIPKGF